MATRAGIVAATGASVSLGLPATASVLTAMDAGVPIPVPSDVIVVLLGEWASAGRVPVVAAVVVLEAVALVATALLFFAARGPGRALLTRFGPRLSLTAARLAAFLHDGANRAAAPGRGAPWLRLACRSRRIRGRRLIPPSPEAHPRA